MQRGFVAAVFLAFLSGGAAAETDIEHVYEKPGSASWADHLPSFAAQYFRKSKSYALIVGIGDYTEYWNTLKSPYHDALKMREFLIERANFDYVVTLTNGSATKKKITHFMEDDLPKRVKKGDRFLFYFSGHGTQRTLARRIRGYLPMAGSGKSNWSSMIGMDEIENWHENIEQAQHVLFLLDACFSGLAGTEVKADRQELEIKDLARKGHHLITAGTRNQKSFASLKAWGGSLFTSAFVRGAEGLADAQTSEFPRDHVVTLNEIWAYLRKSLKRAQVRYPNINQTPQWRDLLGDSQGEFFFYEKNADLETATLPPSSTPPKGAVKHESKSDGSAQASAPTVIKQASGPSPEGTETEEDTLAEVSAFERAKSGGMISDFEAYLKNYPDGLYAGLARRRINKLKVQ